MVHTVALLGVNGRIGQLALPHLVKGHEAGTIRIIVLIRPGSTPKNLDSGDIEVRQVDLEDSSSLDSALKGVQVLLPTLSPSGNAHLGNIVDALHRSSDAVTFFTPRFGTLFGGEDFVKYPSLKEYDEVTAKQEKRAKEFGVGVTEVLAGVFHDYFFKLNFLNVNVKENKVELNDAQRRNQLAITNTEDIGAALAELCLRDPREIKDQSFSYVSHWITGDEIMKTFTAMHGSPPQVTNYDEKAERALLDASEYGPIAAAYKFHWEKGRDSFGFKNEQEVKGRSFEQTARDALREIAEES